jgi:hypothetical protein
MWWRGECSITMASRCVNNLGGRVILSGAAPDDVDNYVRKNSKEYYEINPGFEFREVRMLLRSPMLIGLKIKKRKILLPFTKPCYGTMLYEVDAKVGDFDFLRSNLLKKSD